MRFQRVVRTIGSQGDAHGLAMSEKDDERDSCYNEHASQGRRFRFDLFPPRRSYDALAWLQRAKQAAAFLTKAQLFHRSELGTVKTASAATACEGRVIVFAFVFFLENVLFCVTFALEAHKL